MVLSYHAYAEVIENNTEEKNMELEGLKRQVNENNYYTKRRLGCVKVKDTE